MSNLNTVADAVLNQNNGQPYIIASTTTLHRAFGATAAAGGVTGAAILTVPNPMALAVSGANFPGRAATSLPFAVRCAGLVAGGQRFAIDINLGLALTQTIASTGTINLGDANDSWFLEALCFWDPNSLFLRGVFYGWAGNINVAQTPLASQQSPAALANLQFNCAVTIINSNVNASFSLTDWSIDLL